jgi:hypothetical protein
MPAPSDSILAACALKWNASANLLALAGTLFDAEVPETLNGRPVVPPYAAVTAEKSRFEWTTEPTYFEQTRLEFCVYCLGAAAAEAAAAAVHAEFDWKPLPFQLATSASLWVQPVDYAVSNTFTRYKTGAVVYRAEISYDVAVQRGVGT